MKAALEIRRWVSLAPIGYINAPAEIGRSLLHDPECALIIREAFEDHATGCFTKQQIRERVSVAGLAEPAGYATHLVNRRKRPERLTIRNGASRRPGQSRT